MSLTVPVLRVPRTLPVLMCHSVPATGGPSGDLQVPLGELREQLRVLRDDGYTVTGLTEALDLGLREPGPRVVALTLDDGYADFLAVAELLADLGCGATLYVPTAHVGGQGMVRDAGRLLTWSELEDLAAAGVELGSHSHRHRPLDVLPAGEFRVQVDTSRAELYERLGVVARSFCYPHGYPVRRAAEVLGAAGYTNACVIGRRIAGPGDDVFAVPRLQLRPGLGAAGLRALISRGEPGVVPRLKRVAAPGWRVVRGLSLRVTGHELT